MGHSSPSQQVVNRVDYPDDGGRIELPETAESHSAVEQPPLAGATKTNVTDTTESTDPANSNPSYAAAETLRESISSDRSSELSESQEMDLLPDDGGLEDDEETGLTGKERRRQWRRLVRQRRQQRQNEAQWPSEVEDVRVTTKERRAADWTVVRRLGINAVLIGLWYLFSLSISVVCLPKIKMENDGRRSSSWLSTTNGCFHQTTSTSTSRSSQPACTP